MTTELRNELSLYLGELMYIEQNTFDWIERNKIINKMNAVYVLLDIDKHDNTFLDVARNILTTLK